jgi:hypothetical protein
MDFRLVLLKRFVRVVPPSNDDLLYGIVPLLQSQIASFDFTPKAVGVGLFRSSGVGEVFGPVFDSYMENSLAPLIKMVFDHLDATPKEGLDTSAAALRENNEFVKSFAPLADKMAEFTLGFKFPDRVGAVFNPLLVSLDEAAAEFINENSKKLSLLGITDDEVQKLKVQIGTNINIKETDDNATRLVKRDLEIRASHLAGKVGVVRVLFLRLVQPQVTVAAIKQGKPNGIENAFCVVAAKSVLGVINGVIKDLQWNSPEILEVMNRRLPEMSAHLAAVAERSSI